MALSLCHAGSAGVSLLETTANRKEVFRAHVLVGALTQYDVGGMTKRQESPCGVCLESGTPVLFSHPERYFTDLQAAKIPIVEALILPLIADNHALGTIWIMSHDEQRHFDSEDVRVMTSLANFTIAALVLKERQTQELLVKNAQLEAEIGDRKRAEQQERESEEKYRTLFDSIDEGFCIIERVEGESINFRYVEAIRAFVVQTGVSDIVGRTIREAFPDAPEEGYEIYENVLKTGESIRFEIEVSGIDSPAKTLL